jgi:two-component system, chemotaxis family, protein-glutamate methylesterase/glutaminase
VLVIDDSAVVRQTIAAMLGQVEGIKVQTAADPLIALGNIARERPDVIVLDLEIPRVNGLTFLRSLMATDPIPVVICSGLAAGFAQDALRALDEGAVSIVIKPKLAGRNFPPESAMQLVDAVRSAAASRMPRELDSGVQVPQPQGWRLPARTDRVIAIGASAGGTEALREVLGQFPADAPGTLVVQHMPETFTAAFAARLDQLCAVEVKEAEDGDAVVSGRVLIAPGNKHLRLRRRGGRFEAEVADGPLVARHRPSADVLFRSVAQTAGARAAAALLTGMGDDGAQGLLELRRAGAFTVAQDEASCMIFGMPREAIARGAAQEVQPLGRIAAALLTAVQNKKAAGSRVSGGD